MSIKSAREAFNELGFGDAEMHNGMPKLEFLALHDPDLLRDLVDRYKSAGGGESEMWHEWFRDYPSLSREGDGLVERHLEVVRMQYHLFPVAAKVAAATMNGSLMSARSLFGAAWQYTDRSGGDWSMGQAYMVVVTMMSPFGSESEESRHRTIKWVAQHIDEVVELIPEIAKANTTSLERVKVMVRDRYPEEPSPETQ